MLTYGGTEVQDVTYNGQAVSSVTYNGVEVWTAFKPVLNDNSWADIKKISQSGKAANYISIGDTKNVLINGTIQTVRSGEPSPQQLNASLKAVVIGINHNASVEGGNKIHFALMKDTQDIQVAISTSGMVMYNHSHSTEGGWRDCYMRTITLPSLKNALPTDLKNVLGTVNKWSDNGGTGKDIAADVTQTTDDLYLISEFELYGSRTYANSAEKNKQKQYDYWKNGNETGFHFLGNDPKYAEYTWLRSVCVGNGAGQTFCCTSSSSPSSPDLGIANAPNCWFPCFVI